MTIQYAILGLLSWRPLSGYDLKKLIAQSTAFYWSGNNNQIYKTLVQLHEAGLVTQEVQLQDSLPARKIYRLTETGQAALRQWVKSPPAPPEFRSTFLIQLAWADLLEPDALEGLLNQYEEEVQMQLQMQQEIARRAEFHPDRTLREAFLWKMIDRSLTGVYENELRWLRELRDGLARL